MTGIIEKLSNCRKVFLRRLPQGLLKVVGISVALFCTNASAKIVSEDLNNFDLRYEVKVNASLEKLTATFENVGTWWHPDHTFSGDSKNMSFDKKSLCFCESLENGGFVRHLDWVFYQPGQKARFVGGLGPLQTLPVDGVLTFYFKSESKGESRLTVTYRVSSSGDRLKGWPKAVHQVLGEQVGRLKSQAEK